MWKAADSPPPSIEPIPQGRAPQWQCGIGVPFCLDVSPNLSEPRLNKDDMPHLYTQVGCPSVPRGCGLMARPAGACIHNGGAGIHIEYPDGEQQAPCESRLANLLQFPGGREMVVLQAALRTLVEHPTHTEDPILVCCAPTPSWRSPLFEKEHRHSGRHRWAARYGRPSRS